MNNPDASAISSSNTIRSEIGTPRKTSIANTSPPVSPHRVVASRSHSVSSNKQLNKNRSNSSSRKNSPSYTASAMRSTDHLYIHVNNSGSPDYSQSKHRYPCCIVWTPLPLITWFIPFIGHMGICQENGVIRDFQGPYSIGEGRMAFGNPTKYWKLNVNKITQSGVTFDGAVHESCEEYKNRMHILCWDNCHSHVAYALNRMKYNGHSSYNMVSLCFLMLIFGKYTSCRGFIATWLPFAIVCIITTVIVLLTTVAK